MTVRNQTLYTWARLRDIRIVLYWPTISIHTIETMPFLLDFLQTITEIFTNLNGLPFRRDLSKWGLRLVSSNFGGEIILDVLKPDLFIERLSIPPLRFLEVTLPTPDQLLDFLNEETNI